jgi:acetyl-CoA carboxylase carboxyltransferase component
MFITGPAVIKETTGEEIDPEGLGGAMVHNTKSGVAHFACDSDAQAIDMIKELLSYLPLNNKESPPIIDSSDDPHRTDPALDAIIPDEPRRVYDMRKVIRSIVDNGQILEPHYHYAKNIIVCFARLNGRTVGIIANQPMHLAGCLDVNAADKATRFIRFCDAFNIPLLTLADVPGYLPGTDQEWSGIIRHGAKLLWCYSEATVPKLTLVTRKDYGGSYLAMCSRDLGADMVFAWPTAEIAVMGAEGAVAILYRKEISAAESPQAKREEKLKEYRNLLYNPYIAASRGYIDEVITPQETRPRLIAALEFLRTKKETRPQKKHGNIPM